MTLVSNWNPSNTLGGLQQHTSGSGAQEMPLDIPEDDDGIGQSLYNSMLGKDILFKNGHVNNNTLITSDMRGYGEVFGQDLPDSSTGKNTLFKSGHVSNNTSMATAESSAPISDEGACHVGRKTNNIQRI